MNHTKLARKTLLPDSLTTISNYAKFTRLFPETRPITQQRVDCFYRDRIKARPVIRLIRENDFTVSINIHQVTDEVEFLIKIHRISSIKSNDKERRKKK